jgi:hypothetical protein
VACVDGRPAVCFGLNLSSGDEFPMTLGETQSLGNDQGVAGDASQRPGGHLLFGAVGKKTAAFLSHWAIPLASQSVGVPEKSVEHGRSSKMNGKGQRFDYRYVAFNRREEAVGFCAFSKRGTADNDQPSPVCEWCVRRNKSIRLRLDFLTLNVSLGQFQHANRGRHVAQAKRVGLFPVIAVFVAALQDNVAA